jgi:kynurenine formamidase
MIANTGTYLDSPFHRFADRPDLAAVALELVADLEGLVISIRERRARDRARRV